MRAFRKFQKPLSVLLALTLLENAVMPTVSMAITGYDSMPEYRSFEPVATTNMVNVFDGSFSYNIPLMDVPNGYPISLSYHSSDVNNEELSSWVGLGWTLNPGAINRTKRGFPDEFNGQSVTYYHKLRPNWTVSADAGMSPEIFGSESLVNLDLGASLTYNNYNGMGSAVTAGLGLAGVASLNFSYSQGRFGFNPTVNPGALLDLKKNIDKNKKKKQTSEVTPTDQEEQKKKAEEKEYGKRFSSVQHDRNLKDKSPRKSQINFSVGGMNFSSSRGSWFSSALNPPQTSFPNTTTPYHGFSVRLKASVGTNVLPLPLDAEGYLNGSYARQWYDDSETKSVYGYHYLEGAQGSSDMMDFFTDNDTPFEKRDNILAIPFPNNDMYSLTGEAMGGSFRPYRSEYGHYRQNESKSSTVSVTAGADINLPSLIFTPPPVTTNLVTTLGVELGGDYHWLKIGDWDSNKKGSQRPGLDFKSESSYTKSNEKFFMRFTGDLGGSYDLSGSDAPFKAALNTGVFRATPEYDGWDGNSSYSTPDFDTRSNKHRSSYVRYNTVNDFSFSSNGYKYKVYEKSPYYFDLSSDNDGIPDNTSVQAYNRTSSEYGSNSNTIGELVTNNADGITYVYGLPIYARNEKQLSYSLDKSNSNNYDITAGGGLIASINYNVEGTLNNSPRHTKTGYTSDQAYPTTFLLTQILGNDYIDRTMNGPSTDDFGSYTRFGYSKIHGANGQWYAHRSPYTGMNFSYGTLSSDDDDIGSYTYCEKENYYLQSIASKTHVAIFTLEDRDDGKGAKLNATSNGDALAKGTDATATSVGLKRLKRIDLYSINDVVQVGGSSGATSGIYRPKNAAQDGYDALPIKTVRFEYDYTLCSGLPNNSTGAGKLTLKKVWFEYEGKLTSKISPYTFGYYYPVNTTNSSFPANYSVLNPGNASPTNTKYPSAYSNLENYGASTVQNPSYNVLNTDRWGNYRNFAGLSSNIGANLARFWPYVNQAVDLSFDPAAYCLKRIVLPSGGEIHVQYEQHDYQYVQDKRASVMVPLSTALTSNDESMGNLNNKKYYLDLSKIGVTLPGNNTDRAAMIYDMFDPMNTDKQRIYFNFLYALLGNTVDYTKNTSEYIEGYARISGFGYDGNGVYFKFKSDDATDVTQLSSSGIFYQKIDYDTKTSKRELPRKVCLDFLKTQRRGKINGESNALENAEESQGAEDVLKAFATLVQSLTTSDNCIAFEPSMSYVRVQAPVAKKGGGVRVKRLLMFDDGIVSSEPNSLYGSEYTYTTTLPGGGVISSGVAANEPGTGRRENSLVNPIEKDEQTKWEAIMYGRDMYSQEGPLGESIMPGASVGYSKVTIKSIHSGKTSTGYEVHEFYTCKDYPFKAERTTIDEAFKTKLGAGGSIKGVGGSYKREDPYMSQGYSFISNSMHGQVKRVEKYAAGASQPMAWEQYEYLQFTPGETVKVMDENFKVSTVSSSSLGKESEVLSEMRQVEDVSTGGTIGADISWGGAIMPPPIPPVPVYISTIKPSIGNGSFSFYWDEKILHTHVTNKIISYPAIIKKTINHADGVTQVSENEVYDYFSGKPVVVKSYDDFDKVYTNYDFMASWSHENFRSKSTNELLSSKAEFYNNSGYYLRFTSASGTCSDVSKFVKGDMISVTPVNNASAHYVFHVDEVKPADKELVILPSGMNSVSALSNGSMVNIIIERSGYNNQLNAKQGNIMFHNAVNPVLTSNQGAIQSFVQTLNSAVKQMRLTSTSQSVSIPSGLCMSKTGAPGLTPTGVNLSYNPGFPDQFIFSVTWQGAAGCEQTLTMITGEAGYFMYDQLTNKLYYFADACSTKQELTCFTFCSNPVIVHRVVTASATSFSDNWPYDESLYTLATPPYSPNSPNNYEKGFEGKWRPYKQFAYREKLNPNSSTDINNYGEGVFDLTMFDWKDLTKNDDSRWVLTNTTTKYSPNGFPIEDKNILNVASTAKFGYNHTKMVLVAQNAEDHSVAFEGFENLYTSNKFEDNLTYSTAAGTRTSTVSHTGSYSILMQPNANLSVGTITLNQQVQTEGLLVRGWFHTGKTSPSMENKLKVSYNSQLIPMKKVASAGEWTLFEAMISNPGSSGTATVSIVAQQAGIYVDDVRVQPMQSEMTCYVYDTAQRLIAVLDDQHFALLYQYNAEGALVRKLKETTEGIKTISETQYNSKGDNR